MEVKNAHKMYIFSQKHVHLELDILKVILGAQSQDHENGNMVL